MLSSRSDFVLRPFAASLSAALSVLVISAFAGTLPLCAAEKPNIVIILADGMGYGDAQCFQNHESPNSNPDGTPGQLFNLKDDLGETKNLFAAEPARVAEMKTLLTKIQGNDAPAKPLNGQPEHDDTKE